MMKECQKKIMKEERVVKEVGEDLGLIIKKNMRKPLKGM